MYPTVARSSQPPSLTLFSSSSKGLACCFTAAPLVVSSFPLPAFHPPSSFQAARGSHSNSALLASSPSLYSPALRLLVTLLLSNL